MNLVVQTDRSTRPREKLINHILTHFVVTVVAAAAVAVAVTVAVALGQSIRRIRYHSKRKSIVLINCCCWLTTANLQFAVVAAVAVFDVAAVVAAAVVDVAAVAVFDVAAVDVADVAAVAVLLLLLLLALLLLLLLLLLLPSANCVSTAGSTILAHLSLGSLGHFCCHLHLFVDCWP